MSLVYETSGVEETERLGELLAPALENGLFLGLSGTLGAGKTAFVRGLCRGLGVPPEARVASPTFGIVHTYSGGRVAVHHADLYRVRDASELYDSGFYDLVGGDGLLVVEWLDRVPEVAPEERLVITLERLDAGRRRLAFDAWGPAAERALGLLGHRLRADAKA
jgi:tRNA threonylcarbamoyladenosine biosynthesis protein TsaE